MVYFVHENIKCLQTCAARVILSYWHNLIWLLLDAGCLILNVTCLHGPKGSSPNINVLHQIYFFFFLNAPSLKNNQLNYHFLYNSRPNVQTQPFKHCFCFKISYTNMQGCPWIAMWSNYFSSMITCIQFYSFCGWFWALWLLCGNFWPSDTVMIITA